MERKNFAFISYNHNDVKWAKWLQKNLENYKLPTEIHNEFEDSRFIRPVFRDQTDLNTGVLGNVLRDNLEASKYLIVLCSPNSAKSEWVSKEVQSFIEWGRLDCIIPLIVDGQPNCYNPDLECFPRYLKEYTKEHPEAELLGVSIAEVGQEKAFVRVVSKMLGVSFDTLWKRHERERRRKIIVNTSTTLISLFLLYWFAIPMQLTMHIHDANHQLPFGTTNDGYGGILTVNGNEYLLTKLDTAIELHSIAGFHRLGNVDISFTAPCYYDSICTSASIGSGLHTDLSIQLKRDDTFRFLAGTIMNGDNADGNLCPISGAVVTIEETNLSATTDANGHFSIDIPIDQQRETMNIRVTATGFEDLIYPDEVIGNDVTYVMHK